MDIPPPSLFDGTVFDAEITTHANDLPTWLRDLFERVFSPGGIPNKKKLASEEAIDSLQEVDYYKIRTDRCPICFDDYEKNLEKKSEEKESTPLTAEDTRSDKYKKSIELNRQLSNNLRSHSVNNIQSLETSSQFKDPSLFFPADSSGSIPFRFPSSNLSTLEPLSEDQMNLVFEDEQKKSNPAKEKDESSHVAVKMPNCKHVFGKSCIIEWLKSSVSCPLCRKEVEANEESPQARRERRIRQEVQSNFNPSPPNDVADHLIHHLTDVFRPFRRTPNPLITPLTDSYMPQDWSTPTYPINRVRSETGDPNLILPRKIPIGDLNPSLASARRPRAHVISISRPRTRTEINGANSSSDSDDNDANDITTNNTSNANDESSGYMRGQGNFESQQRFNHVSNTVSPSDNILSRGEVFNDNSSTSSMNTTPQSIPSALVGSEVTPASALLTRINSGVSDGSSGGGPERSRRSTPSSSRSHPYARPNSDD